MAYVVEKVSGGTIVVSTSFTDDASAQNRLDELVDEAIVAGATVVRRQVNLGLANGLPLFVALRPE